MVVKSVAINAYQNAMDIRRRTVDSTVSESLKKPQEPVRSFNDTLKTSLVKVNDLQSEKKVMIEEFASGKSQNVHELMIAMQKAGMAMQMTGAVRSKVMSAYKEIMQMPF
ncbi:flagellar hook-basal body complex protein FliE [Pseudodesulfovibrio thermohalotolerans]|uniref:flagellar hook-basal body complex protein FliE n=1 Tax=Pseudodesulfovibrio thermohalotolerans TaxID=2880651 RepID=UPI0022BA0073|nr:flagellar hook-basal body complex protein FliE [Pseudodesulfovibrio thermohalotolerans]WFS61493.1 flagellar hook-basal body complex protein FliE [Pseudodesulfovibrio thermohalotolerans]